ncbi:MAG: hypothetical protein QM779_11570 [Propionicimonas sp.]|uniref:hypothetical protein n=1 Tax=Propionicimonas sp. TaxID=1955623 RepID=UPI003D12F00D
MEVSPRLSRWISASFPTASAPVVLQQLAALTESTIGGQDPERIQAAMVLDTHGSHEAFRQRLELARIDWRDLLVGAGLANEDWPRRLDALLGEQ